MEAIGESRLDLESDHLHTSAGATLGVDDLAAVGGRHPGSEAQLAYTLDLADSAGVMHVRSLVGSGEFRGSLKTIQPLVANPQIHADPVFNFQIHSTNDRRQSYVDPLFPLSDPVSSDQPD